MSLPPPNENANWNANASGELAVEQVQAYFDSQDKPA